MGQCTSCRQLTTMTPESFVILLSFKIPESDDASYFSVVADLLLSISTSRVVDSALPSPAYEPPTGAIEVQVLVPTGIAGGFQIDDAVQRAMPYLDVNDDLTSIFIRVLIDLSQIDDVPTSVPLLGSAKNLHSLSLAKTNVRDISGLKNLVVLRTLWLQETSVANITPLETCPGLRELNLQGTPVVDIAPLQHLQHLEVLKLGGTCVGDVTALEALLSLRTVELQCTTVDSVASLANHNCLVSLNISDTSVKSIDPLATCASLRILKIEFTPIRNIDALAGCPVLSTVCYGGSRVESVPVTLDLEHVALVSEPAEDPGAAKLQSYAASNQVERSTARVTRQLTGGVHD